MTKPLALINTVVTLLLGVYIILGIGVAGDDSLVHLMNLLSIIFLVNIVTGWLVATGSSNKFVNSAWRVSQTITILVLLYILGGSVYTIFTR